MESYRAKFAGSQADRAAAALETLSVSNTNKGTRTTAAVLGMLFVDW